MTDPVTRAARRQNLLDRLAELLAGWGCPPDLARERAGGLLIVVEEHGWTLPTIPTPPIRGRGSTAEGRARARRILEQTRAGCICPSDTIGNVPDLHQSMCPVRRQRTPADPSSVAADALTPAGGLPVPDRGVPSRDETFARMTHVIGYSVRSRSSITDPGGAL